VVPSYSLCRIVRFVSAAKPSDSHYPEEGIRLTNYYDPVAVTGVINAAPTETTIARIGYWVSADAIEPQVSLFIFILCVSFRVIARFFKQTTFALDTFATTGHRAIDCDDKKLW